MLFPPARYVRLLFIILWNHQSCHIVILMILSDSTKSPELHSKYYQRVALGIEFPTQENLGPNETIATEVSERIPWKGMKICFFCRNMNRHLLNLNGTQMTTKQIILGKSSLVTQMSWLGLLNKVSVTQKQLHHCKGNLGKLHPWSPLHRLWAGSGVRISFSSNYNCFYHFGEEPMSAECQLESA